MLAANLPSTQFFVCNYVASYCDEKWGFVHNWFNENINQINGMTLIFYERFHMEIRLCSFFRGIIHQLKPVSTMDLK